MVQINEPQASIRPIVVAPAQQQHPQETKPEAAVNKELTAVLHIKNM